MIRGRTQALSVAPVDARPGPSDAIVRVTPMDSIRQPALTRRSLIVFGGAMTIGVVGLAGCSGQDTVATFPSQTPDPNVDARKVAMATARQLRDRLAALALTDPKLTELSTQLADGHRRQLTALGTDPDDGTTSTEAAADTVTDLISAEQEAAAATLGDLVSTGPSTAALLAQIAAADAMYADLLALAAHVKLPGTVQVPDGTPSETTTSTTVDENTLSAWSRMLTGEYAAVYAFGVVRAKVPSGHRSQADADWETHRRRRDDLAARLAAAGATLPTAQPAYDLGQIGDTTAQTIQLAARVETAMADLTAECLPLLRAADRPATATALVASVRRAVGWSHAMVPLPALPVTG
jgi:hypothetical protein